MAEVVKLGQLVDASQKRDAIHIAIAPVVATERLFPSQDIGFVEDGNVEKVGACKEKPSKWLGIVDPFLKGPVFPDERFLMFLYPNTITSLRHDWTHPAFAQSEAAAPVAVALDAKAESMKWLKGFAEHLDITYNALMEAANEYLETGDRTVQHGSEWWRDQFSGHEEEFWNHFEIVTGKKVEERTASIFCCSC